MKGLIVSDPDILDGTPVFAGTRVPVKNLTDCLEGGGTIDVFLDDFPSVSRAQVIAFLVAARTEVTAHALAAAQRPMRVLLDECLPRRLCREFPGHDVSTVPLAGWAGLSNGKLLARIAGRFDAFITVDKNLPSQNGTATLPFGVIVLRAPSNQLADLLPLVPRVIAELDRLQPGHVVVVAASAQPLERGWRSPRSLQAAAPRTFDFDQPEDGPVELLVEVKGHAATAWFDVSTLQVEAL